MPVAVVRMVVRVTTVCGLVGAERVAQVPVRAVMMVRVRPGAVVVDERAIHDSSGYVRVRRRWIASASFSGTESGNGITELTLISQSM